MARVLRWRVPRLGALAAAIAAFTQHGGARWFLLAAFALILAVEVVLEWRQQRSISGCG
jgi:hypothetical protein